MQKSVAITLAITVALVALWIGSASQTTSVWSTFEDYLAAAKAHDIVKLKSLSYQLSAVCQDALEDDAEEDLKGCIELMDSVSFIARNFRQEDFLNVASDDKQIIMSTNYLGSEGGGVGTKTVLYFVRAEDGRPKVLGIRFCYGDESDSEQCVRTRPDTRDMDKDGWWDDVETLFKSN